MGVGVFLSLAKCSIFNKYFSIWKQVSWIQHLLTVTGSENCVVITIDYTELKAFQLFLHMIFPRIQKPPWVWE